MKTIRSALLAAAVLAGVPSMAFALPDTQADAQTEGGRPIGPGRFERRPDATPEQSRPQVQPQQQQRQDFGGRQDFRSRPDQAQAPAPAQFDGQRPQGPGRFNRPDTQPGGGNRRPNGGQFTGRPSDNRAPGFGGGDRFDRPDTRTDPNAQYRGNDRRFDGNNRFPGDNRRFDDNGRYRGGDDRFDNNRSSGGNRFQPDWRNDRRYDWRGYRNSNRQLYRAPRYSPPRGYGFGYRPFARGYQLQPFFYGQNYWINDPWQYRLPPAYGSYRWVRYYNDVLLVDTYSGTVVDVIQNFFW